MDAAWGETGDSVGGWITYMDAHHKCGKAWTRQDPCWQYIEKFDTFHLRQWVSDCGVTREALKELEYFSKTGKTSYIYRHINDATVTRHLETLDRYWD